MMEQANPKHIILFVAVAALAGMVVGSAVTLALLSTNRAIPSTGTVTAVGVGIYSDADCTINLTSIDWGNVYPGDSVSRAIYVKNIGNVPITLTMATNGWNPSIAEGQLNIAWNIEGASLNPGESTTATLTLTVSATVHDVTSFTANVIITGSG